MNELVLVAARCGAHPIGGERAPDVTLVGAGATRLHELLTTGNLAVLSVAAARVEVPGDLQSIATAAEAGAASGYQPGHVYLIRPDAYVARSARSGDASAIVAALQHSRVG